MITEEIPLETRHEIITHLQDQINELTKVIEKRDTIIFAQQNQLKDLIRRLYGRRSEKLDPNQLLMDEVILEADQTQPKEIQSDVPQKESVVKTYTRKHPGRNPIIENLPRKDHYLDIKESDKRCDCCGKDCIEIGVTENERLDFRKRQSNPSGEELGFEVE